MGYRSIVTIAVTKEAYLKHANQTVKDHLKYCDEVTLANNIYYFKYDWVKWYEDYEDVKCVTDFVYQCGEDAALLRIGEDDNDTERIGETSEFEMYVSREPDYPKGDTEVNRDILFACNSIQYILEKE